MTSQELAIAITQTEQIASVFAKRALIASEAGDMDTCLENQTKYLQCLSWIDAYKAEAASPDTHFDNI